MLDNYNLVSRTDSAEYKFTILIPSWNNLEYLKLCIDSIRKHSHLKHQMIVVLNEGVDGSLEWIMEQNDLDYVHSEINLGICFGLNACRPLINTNLVVYANDDMFFLPNWDVELQNEINKLDHDNFIFSSTAIEPTETGNPCVIVADYGDTILNFKKEKLLTEFHKYTKNDWSGSTWPPIILPLKLWDLVGGMSIEFSPGFYSDPDLSMKLWKAGVRYFKGIGKSRVYHFGSKSTKRAKMNKQGRELFLNKWGISSSFFTKHFLKRGEPFKSLNEPKITAIHKIINKIKKFLT